MFTEEEKFILKELVSLEIDEIKEMIITSLQIDVDDLRRQVDVLEGIVKKLK